MVDRVFFRDPTEEEEKEVVGLAENRFRRSRSASLTMYICGVITILGTIGMVILQPSSWSSGLALLFLSLIFFILGLVNNSSSKKTFAEFRQGHFLVQDIEVKDMLYQAPYCEYNFALAIRTKEETSFELPVSGTIYRNFSIGMQGVLAVMYGEEGLYHAERYFFLPGSRNIQLSEEAFSSSFDAEGNSAELPSSVLTSLSKRRLSIPITMFTCAFPYLLGFIFSIVSAENVVKPSLWRFPLALSGIFSMVILFIGTSSYVMLDHYLGKGKRNSFMFYFWMFTPAAGMCVNIITFIWAPGILFLLSHIAWFAAILCFALMLEYKVRALSRDLNNGNVEWARGKIIRTEKRSYVFSRTTTLVPFITVRLNNGGTLFFDVYKDKNARHFKEGATGYVIRVKDTFRGETVSHYYFEMDQEEGGSDS